MGDYFEPLRRKIGVVALLMACVFVAMWLRSLLVQDIISFPIGYATARKIKSTDGYLIIRKSFAQRVQVSSWPIWEVHEPIRLEEIAAKSNDSRMWRFCGIDVFERGLFVWWVISYWVGIIPLTLLSAWLLLSKPRTKKSSA